MDGGTNMGALDAQACGNEPQDDDSFAATRAAVLAQIECAARELQALMVHVRSFIDDAHETGEIDPETLAAAAPIEWETQARLHFQMGIMAARRAVHMPVNY